jgi:hypothetical protein
VIFYTSNGETRQEFSIVLTAQPLAGQPTPISESSEVRWVAVSEVPGTRWTSRTTSWHTTTYRWPPSTTMPCSPDQARQARPAPDFARPNATASSTPKTIPGARAVSAGGLGAVGAAFAAYIGKTFIRSRESAASHLRAYFDQRLELSRYLAAERLLVDAKEPTPEQRAAIVSSLAEAIATAGQPGDKAKDSKPMGRGLPLTG